MDPILELSALKPFIKPLPPNDHVEDPRSFAQQVLDKPSIVEVRDRQELARCLKILDDTIAEKMAELGLEFAYGEDLGVRGWVPDRLLFKIRTTRDDARPMSAAYSFQVTFRGE